MSSNPNRSKRYTDEFKLNIVKLTEQGKGTLEISKEFNIARSTVEKWKIDYNSTKSFKAKDNKPLETKELEALIKENKRLKMENDILKQAALILAQK